MATTITKILLSGSVDGRSIGITASLGTTYNTIHTGASGATTTIDEVYIYAQNNFSETVQLVLEFGASSTANTIVALVVPQDGPQLIVPGFLLLGSATAAVDIVAYHGGTASLVTSGAIQLSIYGWVNRIVQT